MAEDRHLLKRLRCGDRDALRVIYEKYKDDLVTVAVSLLSDFHTAQDCLQDIFVGFAAGGNKLNVRRIYCSGFFSSSTLGRSFMVFRPKSVKTSIPPTCKTRLARIFHRRER